MNKYKIIRLPYNQINMNLLQNIPYCVEAIMESPIFEHNLCIAIPCGVKGMVWFTQNNCHILTLSKDRRSFDNVTIDSSVVYYPLQDTLLYGTFYFINNNEQFYFTIEDIFTYKNTDVSTYSIDVKIHIWKYLLDYEISSFDMNHSPFIIGIPFMAASWKEICGMLPHISYKIQSIRFHSNSETQWEKLVFTTSRIHYHYLITPNDSQKNNNDYEVKQTMGTFLVQADSKIDIYYLYTETQQEYIGVACVQTLKTSNYLNTIFRNIKEDMNLDTLEESDDEYDSCHMVADTTKMVRMECVYNTKFKKWTPIRLSQ